MRFATRDVYGANTNPFNVLGDMQLSSEMARYFSILTRWFDYNDTFLAKEWAHPSDNIGTAFASLQIIKKKIFRNFYNQLFKCMKFKAVWL